MFLRVVLLFSLFSTVAAFEAPIFSYGCNITHCQYIFKVPEVVASYVDPRVLNETISNLTTAVTALNAQAKSLNGTNLDGTAFNTAFSSNYTKTQQAVQDVYNATMTSFPAFVDAMNNSTALLANSKPLYDLADCLYNALNLLEQNKCLVNYPITTPSSEF